MPNSPVGSAPKATTGASSTATAKTSSKKSEESRETKICVQCDRTFTEEENRFDACSYHAGDMELMDETVIDLLPSEEDLYDLDTVEIRARHPEAFRWSCCYASGTKPGCRRGRHESDPDRDQSNRGQFTDLDVAPLLLDEEVVGYSTGARRT